MLDLARQVSMLDEEYLTASEITKRFKVTRQAVYKWIADGKLKAIRIGGAVRIPKSALEAFIKPAESTEIDLAAMDEGKEDG